MIYGKKVSVDEVDLVDGAMVTNFHPVNCQPIAMEYPWRIQKRGGWELVIFNFSNF
jgi:hypothetical protein